MTKKYPWPDLKTLPPDTFFRFRLRTPEPWAPPKTQVINEPDPFSGFPVKEFVHVAEVNPETGEKTGRIILMLRAQYDKIRALIDKGSKGG